MYWWIHSYRDLQSRVHRKTTWRNKRGLFLRTIENSRPPSPSTHTLTDVRETLRPPLSTSPNGTKCTWDLGWVLVEMRGHTDHRTWNIVKITKEEVSYFETKNFPFVTPSSSDFHTPSIGQLPFPSGESIKKRTIIRSLRNHPWNNPFSKVNMNKKYSIKLKVKLHFEITFEISTDFST